MKESVKCLPKTNISPQISHKALYRHFTDKVNKVTSSGNV